MKNLLSFPSARKVAAVLVAVLRALENTLTAAVCGIVALRARLSDALENFTGGRDHE